MSTIILQKYANREYRLTNQSVFGNKKKAGDKYAEKQAEKYATAVHSTYVLSQNLQEGMTADLDKNGGRLSVFGEVDARQALRSLDIINEFQTTEKSTVKGGWGHLSKPTSFTKNARHRLLEAGAIVDKFCGLNAYEVTCTLPGSTRDSMRLLAENTGWIMNELTQIIRRAKCKYWFYVWELQKRGALHLHLLIASPAGSMENLALKLQSRWWQLLTSISCKTGRDVFARKTGGTWFGKSHRWQSHIAPIQKSVAAYFSKYAGKGRSPSSKSSTSNQPFCPSRWWGCSTEIKEQIKLHRRKYILTVSTSTSLEIENHLKNWLASPGRVRQYEYTFELGETKNGTNLGGGKVQINYYDSEAFARMQTWEKYVWEECLDIARRHGEYEDSTQTWTDADMACRHILHADMDRRRHELSNADIKTHASTPPPLNQPDPPNCKLRKSRGTQAKPTLDLRVQLVKFLTGGGGVDFTRNFGQPPHQPAAEQPPVYIQGELFCKELYNEY